MRHRFAFSDVSSILGKTDHLFLTDSSFMNNSKNPKDINLIKCVAESTGWSVELLEIKECAAVAGIGRNANEKNFAGLDFFFAQIAKEMVKRNRGGGR